MLSCRLATVQDSEEEFDRKFLALAAKGDADAWRVVVEYWSPRIYAYLRSNTRNEELAEEITQSVFCTIARKLADYVEQGHFQSWIFRIAINRLRDEMRRRKLHAKPMDSDILSDVAPQKAVDDKANAEEIQALREAMDQLSDSDRVIIDLRHQGEMSFQQIAIMLSEPLGTLLARHHRAIRKLRDLMRRHMGGDAS
ncbi:MAG: sigma-70 family RNA polymerase sigma factor [Phycisphaerales bacterium]|nr:sigma-70 family RNA polymerase sigma factor [Phycisphaerales bacterium]